MGDNKNIIIVLLLVGALIAFLVFSSPKKQPDAAQQPGAPWPDANGTIPTNTGTNPQVGVNTGGQGGPSPSVAPEVQEMAVSFDYVGKTAIAYIDANGRVSGFNTGSGKRITPVNDPATYVSLLKAYADFVARKN